MSTAAAFDPDAFLRQVVANNPDLTAHAPTGKHIAVRYTCGRVKGWAAHIPNPVGTQTHWHLTASPGPGQSFHRTPATADEVPAVLADLIAYALAAPPRDHHDHPKGTTCSH